MKMNEKEKSESFDLLYCFDDALNFEKYIFISTCK